MPSIHRRRSSAISPPATPTTPTSPSHSRSTHTPIRTSTHSRRSSVRSLRPSSSPADAAFAPDFTSPPLTMAADGMGSLADELGEDGWDEEDDAEIAVEDMEPRGPAPQSPVSSPPRSPAANKRRSRGASLHSLSESRKESDMWGGLDGMAAEIARLAQPPDGARDGAAGAGPQRLADGLKDLPSQARLEDVAMRLAHAHDAGTNSLIAATRQLTLLTAPLLSPLNPPPPHETIDELTPLLASLALALPAPITHSPSPTFPSAAPPLQTLHDATATLAVALSALTDTLHESRSVAAEASRRLRATRRLCAEWREDVDRAEEAARALEMGGWDARLRGRDAARACGEVVRGFEDVCAGLREQLVRGGGQGQEVGRAIPMTT